MNSTHDMLQEIISLYSRNNLRDAEILCRKILETEPENPDANHFLGVIAWNVGQLNIAKAQIKKAIDLNPNNPSCYLNMGNVFQQEGKYEESLKWYQKTLEYEYAEKRKVYNNIGVALTKLGRFYESAESFILALALDPYYVEAHNNLGEAYKKTGLIEKALQSCERALDIDPDFVSARWNRSILWFLSGDFKKAWPEYEWRWKRPQTPKRMIESGERWQGQNFTGKTLFVYEEQGLGDTLQFMRYLPMVQSLGGSVIFEVVPPLLRLVEKASGFDRLWVGQKNVDTRPVDRFDYHIPLLSLPGIFKTDLETIPAQIPYLKADNNLARIWKKRMGGSDRLKAGVVYAGHPSHNNDHNRSILLSRFLFLKDIEGLELYSLQKEKYRNWTDVESDLIFDHDLGVQISDFADTAAIIENLDLVISVDTAVVHLAGAMGKEVWTLLPFSPDWRWMLDRNDSPWYPTMRLFRQPSPRDWDSVMNEVKKALVQKINH